MFFHSWSWCTVLVTISVDVVLPAWSSYDDYSIRSTTSTSTVPSNFDGVYHAWSSAKNVWEFRHPKDMKVRDVGPTVSKKDAKANFFSISAKTETFLKLKDRLVADAKEFPLNKTLIALDLDRTLRDDNHVRRAGSMLILENSTREFLEWAKANQVPVIIVTARQPDSSTWGYTWNQVYRDLKIANLIGDHVPTRISNASIRDPCENPYSVCNVFEYTYKSLPQKLQYVEAFGLLVAGDEIGEALTHFIEIHGMDVSQVVFADDFVTQATTVARICTREDQIKRVLGVWIVRDDHSSATKEFVDGVFDANDKLMACFRTENVSVCASEFYKDSWCNRTIQIYLGANSFNPLEPSNLFNVEVVRLGHFPSGADELIGPMAALELAQKHQHDFLALKKLCKEQRHNMIWRRVAAKNEDKPLSDDSEEDDLDSGEDEDDKDLEEAEVQLISRSRPLPRGLLHEYLGANEPAYWGPSSNRRRGDPTYNDDDSVYQCRRRHVCDFRCRRRNDCDSTTRRRVVTPAPTTTTTTSTTTTTTTTTSTTTTTTSSTTWWIIPIIYLSAEFVDQYAVQGQVWLEPGAWCVDPEDGPLVLTKTYPDTATTGPKTVSYTCQDSDTPPNVQTRTRTVTVRGPLSMVQMTPSTITIPQNALGFAEKTDCWCMKADGSARQTTGTEDVDEEAGAGTAREVRCFNRCKQAFLIGAVSAMYGCELVESGADAGCYVHTQPIMVGNQGCTEAGYKCWSTLIEPQACCQDFEGNDRPVQVTSRPGTLTAGTFSTVLYCMDEFTLEQASIPLTMIIDEPPELHVSGDLNIKMTRGVGFTDPGGIFCTDTEDGAIADVPLNSVSKLTINAVTWSGMADKVNYFAGIDGRTANTCGGCYNVDSADENGKWWVFFDLGVIRVVHGIRMYKESGGSWKVLVGSGDEPDNWYKGLLKCVNGVSGSGQWVEEYCFHPRAGRFVAILVTASFTFCEIEILGTAGPAPPSHFELQKHSGTCGALLGNYRISGTVNQRPIYRSVTGCADCRVVFSEGGSLAWEVWQGTTKYATYVSGVDLVQTIRFEGRWTTGFYPYNCKPKFIFDAEDSCQWLFIYGSSDGKVVCGDNKLSASASISDCVGKGLIACNADEQMCQIAATDDSDPESCQLDCNQGNGGGMRACGVGSVGYAEGNAYFFGDWQGTASYLTADVGISFTTNVKFQVTHLGRHERSSNVLKQSVLVTLWSTETESAIATATVTPTSTKSGNYRYETLATPVVLESGKEYRLTQQCTISMLDEWFDGEVPEINLFSTTNYRYATLGHGVNSPTGVYGYPVVQVGLHRRAGMVTFKFQSFAARMTQTGFIDVYTAGTYSYVYECTDSSGQFATLTREIEVGCEGPNPTGMYGGNAVECNAKASADSSKSSFELCQAHCLTQSDCEAAVYFTDTNACESWNECNGKYVTLGDARATYRRVGYCKRVDNPPKVVLDPSECCVNVNGIWNEGGSRCQDNEDTPPPTIFKVNTLVTDTPGVFTMNYRCTDTLGQLGIAARNVTVKGECIAPVAPASCGCADCVGCTTCTGSCITNAHALGGCVQGSIIPHGGVCTTRCADPFIPSTAEIRCVTDSDQDYVPHWDQIFSCGDEPCASPSVAHVKSDSSGVPRSCEQGEWVITNDNCRPNCLDGYFPQPMPGFASDPNALAIHCFKGDFTPEYFLCKKPAAAPVFLAYGVPDVSHVVLAWLPGDANDCAFLHFEVMKSQLVKGYLETAMGPTAHDWVTVDGCTPADLSSRSVISCTAINLIEGATYNFRIRETCTAVDMNGDFTMINPPATMRFVIKPDLLFQIPSMGVTFNPQQLMLAFSVDVRLTDVDTWGNLTDIFINITQKGTYCIGGSYSSTAADVVEDSSGLRSFVQLTGRRIVVIKPPDNYFQPGCDINVSIMEGAQQTIDTPSKPTPYTNWSFTYIDLAPSFSAFQLASASTEWANIKVKWTLRTQQSCKIFPTDADGTCAGLGCYVTAYTDMSLSHGDGTCADASGNSYDTWTADSQSEPQCEQYCSSLSTCLGYDYLASIGSCDLRFSEGNVPEVFSGFSSWKDGIGSGDIVGVLADGSQRKCKKKALPEYALGVQGSAECPSGYILIFDDEECETAARSIGETWSAWKDTSSYTVSLPNTWCPTRRPKGCFQHVPNGLVFNNDVCDGGVDATVDKRLCKKAVTTCTDKCFATSVPIKAQASDTSYIEYHVSGLWPGTEYFADCTGHKAGKPWIPVVPIPADKQDQLIFETMQDEEDGVAHFNVVVHADCSLGPSTGPKILTREKNITDDMYAFGYTMQALDYKMNCLLPVGRELNIGESAKMVITATVEPVSEFASVTWITGPEVEFVYQKTGGSAVPVKSSLHFEICSLAAIVDPGIDCTPYELPVQLVDINFVFSNFQVTNLPHANVTSGYLPYKARRLLRDEDGTTFECDSGQECSDALTDQKGQPRRLTYLDVDVGSGAEVDVTCSEPSFDWSQISLFLGPIVGSRGFQQYSSTPATTASTERFTLVLTGQGSELPLMLAWEGVTFPANSYVSFTAPNLTVPAMELYIHSPTPLTVTLSNVPNVSALSEVAIAGGVGSGDGYASPKAHIQIGVYKQNETANLCSETYFVDENDWTEATCVVAPGALSHLQVKLLVFDYTTYDYVALEETLTEGQLTYKSPSHTGLSDAGDWALINEDNSIDFGLVVQRDTPVVYVIGYQLPDASVIQMGGAKIPGYKMTMVGADAGSTEIDICASIQIKNDTTLRCPLKRCVDVSTVPVQPLLRMYLGDLASPSAIPTLITLPRPDIHDFGPQDVYDVGLDRTIWFSGNHLGEITCQSTHPDGTQLVSGANTVTIGGGVPCVVSFQNNTYMECKVNDPLRAARSTEVPEDFQGLPPPLLKSRTPLAIRKGLLKSRNEFLTEAQRRLTSSDDFSRELQNTYILELALTITLFPCPPGSKRIREDIGQCEPCPKGRFSTALIIEFPLSCERCPASQYSDVVGATACKNCPVHTYAHQPSDSIRACICKAGYYSQYLNTSSGYTIPGTECRSCSSKEMTNAPLKEEKCSDNLPISELCDAPKESVCTSESKESNYWMVCLAYCPGGVIWPLSKAAFYSLDPKNLGGSKYKPNIARCDPPEACLPWNECDYRYTGYSCGECTFGFYRDDRSGLCVPCGSEQVVGIVIMAAVCIVMSIGGLFGSATFMRVQADIVFRNELIQMAQEQASVLAKSKAILTLFRARDKKRIVTLQRHDIGSSFRFAKTGDLGIVFRVDARGQIFVAGLHEDSCVKNVIFPHWKIISVNGTRIPAKTPEDVTKHLGRAGFPLRFVFGVAKSGGDGEDDGKNFDNDRKMFVMLIGVMNAFNQVSMFDFEWPPIFTMLAEYAAQLTLNFNFFKPECSVPTPYNTKWMGFIAVPYLMMIPLTMSYVGMMFYMFPGLKGAVLSTKKWLLRNAYARTVNMSVILLLPFHLDMLLVPFACKERAEGVYFVSATPDTECSYSDPRYAEMLRISFIGFCVMSFFYSLLVFSLWKSFYWQFGRARVRDTIPFYVGMVEVSVFGQRGYLKELRDRVMHNICAVISYDSNMSKFELKEHLAQAATQLGPRSRRVQEAALRKGVDVTLIAGRQDMEEEHAEGAAGDKEAINDRLEINKGRQRWIASKFSQPPRDGNVVTYGWVLLVNLMWRQLLSLSAIKLSAGNLVVVGAAAIMLLHAGNITMLLLFRPYKSRKVTNVETMMLSALFLVLWCAIIKDLLSNHVNVHLFQDTLNKVNTTIDVMAIALMALVVGVPLYQLQEIATRMFLSMRSTDALLDDIHMTAIMKDESVLKEEKKQAELDRIEELNFEMGLIVPRDMGRKYPMLKQALQKINCSDAVPTAEQRRHFYRMVTVMKTFEVDIDKMRDAEKRREDDEIAEEENRRMLEEMAREQAEAAAAGDFEVVTHHFTKGASEARKALKALTFSEAEQYHSEAPASSQRSASPRKLEGKHDPSLHRSNSSDALQTDWSLHSVSEREPLVEWKMGPLASVAAGKSYTEREQAGLAKTLTQDQLTPKKQPISFGDEFIENVEVRSKHRVHRAQSDNEAWIAAPRQSFGELGPSPRTLLSSKTLDDLGPSRATVFDTDMVGPPSFGKRMTDMDPSMVGPPSPAPPQVDDSRFAVGDMVRVTKKTRLKGKIAVVVDPNFKIGMVQVNMDEDDAKGKLKSFKSSELEFIKAAPVVLPDICLANVMAEENQFKVGDRVEVTKKTRLKGKTAVVVDPNFKTGMVQVNMDEDDAKGKLKSFKCSELALIKDAPEVVIDIEQASSESPNASPKKAVAKKSLPKKTSSGLPKSPRGELPKSPRGELSSPRPAADGVPKSPRGKSVERTATNEPSVKKRNLPGKSFSSNNVSSSPRASPRARANSASPRVSPMANDESVPLLDNARSPRGKEPRSKK